MAADKLGTELDVEKIARAEAEADATELKRAEERRAGQGRWARAQGRVAGWVRGDKRVP
jgi:hypothetical protein